MCTAGKPPSAHSPWPTPTGSPDASDQPTTSYLHRTLDRLLANASVTSCRQRVQQATLEHRGWKGDPLYDVRKLLSLGAERVDERGWERIWAALRDGDPDGEVQACWVAKEKVRDVYLTDDPDEAAERLDDALA